MHISENNLTGNVNMRKVNKTKINTGKVNKTKINKGFALFLASKS